MEVLIAIVGAVIGGLLAAASTAWLMLSRRAAMQVDLANARARGEMLDENLRREAEANRQLRETLANAERSREAAERQAAVIAQQLASRQQQFEEQQRLLDEAKTKLTDAFKAAGADALRHNNAQFLELARQAFEKLMKEASGDVEKKQQAIDGVVKPIKELLEKQNTAISELEKRRLADQTGLRAQLEMIAAAHEKLGSETGKLVSALRRPEVRGRWGELQLRNTVELAGMIDRCDFDEQVTIWNGETTQRPDMVVRLPGRGVIPVDAKVAIDAYLDALDGADAEARSACLRRHAEQVERHMRALANKRYWEGFDDGHAPQLVVMFMPLESALVAALEVKPDLQTQAMRQHVLLATPTLLVALLRAVAYGWQQDALARNAREIAAAGAELYSRMQKFVGDLDRVGANLSKSTAAYNAAIGSLEARVMPATRKLRELHATTQDEIVSPALIDIEVRPIVSAELKSLPQSLVDEPEESGKR